MWKNPAGNKIWIASIDMKNKKAVVFQSYEGVTSFGTGIESLDCK
jgi:hypothetical protein